MSKTTFRDLIYDPSLGAGIPDGKSLRAFIPAGCLLRGSDPNSSISGWTRTRWPGRVDARVGVGRRHGLRHLPGPGRVADRALFPPRVVRQCTPCREGSGWIEKIMHRLEQGLGREEDIELVLDACDNVSPGLGWPPKQTTICVLGRRFPLRSSRSRSCSETSCLSMSKTASVHSLRTRFAVAEDLEAPAAVSVTVDGRVVEARKGELIIEAAERPGSSFPFFATTRG